MSVRNLRDVRHRLHPSSVFRQQWPLFALIVFIAVIYVLQVLLGVGFEERYMAVPADVVAALHSLRIGDLSDAGSLFTLFSAALLHGDVGHRRKSFFY